MKIYFYETILRHESKKDTLLEILTEIDPLLIQYTIWVFMTPILTIVIVMIIHHYLEKEKLASLRNKKTLTELKFLKAQLHPHFLFNTLNNLYTLSLQQSPKTADITQKLYDILEYTFHEDKSPYSSLGEEIDLFNNYIALEKLRYGDRLILTSEISVKNKTAPMIPLLLLSIVENAFKHGASSDVHQPRISISLKESDMQLSFIVENTIPQQIQQSESPYKNGIGIENIKRQLMILYPEQHSYEVSKTQDLYHVHLSINLSTTAKLSNENNSSVPLPIKAI